MALRKAAIFTFLLLAVKFSQQNPILVKAPEAEEPIREDYRLDNDVVPINYKIHLALNEDFFTSKTFEGVIEITLKVISTEDSDKQITLNANSITLPNKDEITLNKKNEILVNLIDKDQIEENSNLERIVFSLKESEKLTKDEEYILRIPYKGTLHEDMYGFYLSSYKVKSGDKKVEYLATTQFQPTHARRAFPCFDEPQYKATFEISITHPSDYQALSNGAVKIRVTKIDKSQTTIFEKTPLMSTYIVAFVVSKFKSLYEFNEHVHENKAWAQPALVDLGKYAHDMGPKIIKELNNYTGLEYSKFSAPIDKLDQIAIPDFSAGAMENWGLVTYRETALLYDENESERRQKQRVATIVAHELAHMWFGNLVTCKWWSSTWLNEGFARYFQYFAVENIEEDWEMEKQFVLEQQRSIFIADSLESSEPLDMEEDEILEPKQISSRFGSITYNKGASIIRMMANFLGKDDFQTGIQNYLKTKQMQNAEPDDLWTAFDSTDALPSDKNLKTIMDSWITQSGYPVVNVEVTGKDVILKQERFISHEEEKEKKEKAEKESWYIPITYTTSDNPKFENTIPEKWLTPDVEQLKLENVLEDESSWLILNIIDSAYYRVNYGDKLWKTLKENGLTEENLKKIDVLNRAQIVDDVLNLARAGKTSYEIALDVTSYLEHEISYYPWYSAFNAFSYIRLRLDPEDKAVPLLKIYIRMLMKELYESVSFDSDVESQVEIYKTALALTWACELGEKSCIEDSKEIFDLYRTANKKIQPDLRKVVYCTAIRNSNNDEDDWAFLLERLSEARLPSEISTIISALGCSTNEVLLNMYLQESVDPGSKILPQDKQSIYTAVISGSPVGFKTAFSFLQSNIADIKTQYVGKNALSSVITTTADRLTTLDQISQFEAFIDEKKTVLGPAAFQAGKDASVQAKKNVAWADKYKEDLYEYLDEVIPATTTTTPPSTTPPSTTPPTTSPEPTTTKDPNSGTSLTVCSTLLVLSILKAVFRS